jgi:hypothetical protein
VIKNKMSIDSTCKFYVITNINEIKSIQNNIKIKKNTEMHSFKVCYSCPPFSGVPYQVVDTLKSITYKIKSIKANYFEIEWDINDRMFYYSPIIKDSLYLKSDRLYWPSNKVILKQDNKK